MKAGRIIVLTALILLLVFLVFIFVTRVGREKKGTSSDSLSSGASVTQDEPGEKKKITLFFLSERDSNLHPEEREIITSSSVVQEAKQVIQELIKGSEKDYLSPLPPHTGLRELFLTKEGIAYLDFSKAIQDEHPSGSSAEISTVYAIVDSLTYNFKFIKKVYIMVEGMEKETLGGHINISRPLLPLYSLIAR